MSLKSSKFIAGLFLAMLLLGVGLSQPLPAASATGALAPPLQQGNEPPPGPELEAAEVVRLFWHEAARGAKTLGKESVRLSELGLSTAEARDPKKVALAFMQTQAKALGLAETEAVEWKPIRAETDDAGNAHVVLQEYYQELPVFASRVIVHIKDTVGVTAANGEYPAAINVSAKPLLSLEAAYKAALHALDRADLILTEQELLIYNPALLGIESSANHLAYRMRISSLDESDLLVIFIDAHTGKLLLNYNDLQIGRNREIYNLNNSTGLPGSQCYNEAGPIAGGSPPADCTNAYTFSGDTYDYFANTHNRDSFNGSGATMQASVRYGTTANAFWNGSQTVYGPGFATKDVVAHEWTHAVTQYTAGLVYAYQSGALNESMSDIFGAMVDRDDWLMGEDTPIGALRSLADPNALGDPAKVSDSQYFCGTQDNGGVHTNSGVPNHTAYRLAEGGTFNGQTITGVGRDTTEDIFYRALTLYLTSGSDFSDTANALRSACSDLFGSGSATCTSVNTTVLATELEEPACGFEQGVPDSYEEDDLVSQAKPITTDGTAQSHNFHDANDNDWVSFSATAGVDYEIETFNLGSRSDTYMYLYDTDGTTVIAENDDSNGTVASFIAWTAPANGTYYVRARHYSSSTFGANTDYDLHITSSGGTTGQDPFEDDDSPTVASTITPNGPAQTHNFHDAGDVDWVRFSATDGANYVLETLNLGNESDTFLELYDTNATTLLRSDDDGGDGLASRIEWTAPANGDYYLRVRHYSGTAFGPNTSYDLRVTTNGVAADSFEPDNTANEANSLTVNDPAQTHNFHVPGDQDWVRFSASASTGYIIETSNLGAQSDTFLELYSTNGITLLQSDDDGGDGLASRIEWTAPTGGNYYVKVRHFFDGASGSDTNYDLNVTSIGSSSLADAFEPDDIPSQASPIIVNGNDQNHNFHAAGDEDWIEFSAITGVDYVISTLNLGSASDTVLELYDTDATTLLALNDDTGGTLASRINWIASTDGTYYLRVRHYSGDIFGADTAYDLRIEGSGNTGLDSYEDDDTSAQANPLTDTQAGHNFHDAGDQDWASFLVAPGTSFVLETFNLGSRSDTILELYDTDATTLLAFNDDHGGTLASRIDWTSSITGVYYARVYHYSNSTFGANTDYDLRLTLVTPGGADLHEPDNTPAEAVPIISNNPPQTHNFHTPGDEDWVTFSATSGLPYTIETLNLGPASDTVLELYDTDTLTLLAINDDGGGGLASRLTWTAPASGSYYVKVRHFSGSASGGDTNYDLQIIGSNGGGDAFEPDNVSTQASSLIVNGSAQTHDFHFAGDEDWVQFEATAGATYFIETFNLGQASDTFMLLYDTDATTLLALDDDGGPEPLASRLEWAAPASGTYYLKLRHYNSSTFGLDTHYDLTVTSPNDSGGDDFEPDNASTLAAPMTVNDNAQTHDFHFAGDEDWVRFAAIGGASYVIRTFNLGSSSDTTLSLIDTDGFTELVFDDDGNGNEQPLASRIEWTAPASGDYFVKVRHFNSFISGPDTQYDLQITSDSIIGPDDFEPDNDSTQANSIRVDPPIDVQLHNFDAAGDEDWVTFSGIQNETCTIQTLNLGGQSDTFLEFYDANLTLLASDDDSGPGLASRIVIQIPTGGISYYVKVRHFASSVFGPTTHYDLTINCSGLGGPDNAEPDDNPAQAVNIPTNGSLVSHNFHVAGDQDWSRFSAAGGTSYILETSGLGPSSDTVMELYDTDGATLISFDDDSGDGFASRLEWTAPANGDYFIRIRHFSNATFGPDTNYNLSVTTSSTLLPTATSVELTVPAAHPGDEVEAVVYLHEAAAAVKVEALAKPTYLNLTEAAPLSPLGKTLGEQITENAERWQLKTTEAGLTSVWYAGKAGWDGNKTAPVLRLRWRLVEPLSAPKLVIPLKLTTIDQNGHATSRMAELPIVMLASEPKIDDVQPKVFANITDTVLSIQGSNFEPTPKVYLVTGNQQIQLLDVEIVDPDPGDPFVKGTVPAGTKVGLYKVRLVNPDGGSVEYDGVEVLGEVPQYGLTLSAATQAQSGSPGSTVTYTLQVTNTGTITDTFDVNPSGHNWLTIPAPNPVDQLASGTSALVNIAVTIPASATLNTTDTATITVTSRGNATISATTVLTTTAGSGGNSGGLRIFLPVILK